MTNVISSNVRRPGTEVTEKASRRRYTAEYKARILREVAACTQRGEVGALLRREGLYSSHLCAWREQAERGQREALAPKKRGPQAKVVDGRDRKIAEQERMIGKLTRRAEQAEAIIEIQKKVSQLLGIALPPITEEPS